ncbi:MAG: AraC family ligand binding domain-containing protein [Clostridia bacterium]|nr:AraC family ligand binding domain-containing protein [Clostridia bacterium]
MEMVEQGILIVEELGVHGPGAVLVHEAVIVAKVKFAGRIHTPIQTFHLHSHTFREVVCYTQGTGTVVIDGTLVGFETEDIFFLPPGSVHSDHADDGFKNIHYEFEDISFPYHTRIKIRDTDAGDFLSVITRLYNEYQLKRKNYAEIVDSLHDVLLHYLTAFSDLVPHHPCVEFAINQIVTNFSDPFYDLNQMMAHIHMNPDYFRKLFKKGNGGFPPEVSYADPRFSCEAAFAP